jgi:hypothetical protein
MMRTTPIIDKFIKLLNDNGISIKEDDELRHDSKPLNNIVFYDNNIIFKVASEQFYRHTGLSKAYEITEDKKGRPLIKVMEMTDDMFYAYLFNLVMLHF